MSADAAPEDAFVRGLRATFDAELQLLRPAERGGGVDREDDARTRRRSAERDVFVRLDRRRKKRAPSLSPASLTPLTPPWGPAALRSLLLTLFRRFAGALLVKGRLLNLEELLVTHIALPGDNDHSEAPAACVRVDAAIVRLVVECTGAEIGQVGKDGVVGRVLGAEEVDVAVDDVWRPVVKAMVPDTAGRSSHKVSPSVWERESALETMDAVYGFSIKAFVADQPLSESSRDDDDDEGVNATLLSSRTFHDLRAPEKMMELTGVDPFTFHSFAFRRLAKKQSASIDSAEHADPWSYKALDAAQKRKWADERFEYGQQLVQKNKLQDAIAEFASCLNLDVRHTRALAAKGRAHMMLHQLPDAVDLFERAMEIDPSSTSVANDLLRAKGTLEHSRHVSADRRSTLGRVTDGDDRQHTRDRDKSTTSIRAESSASDHRSSANSALANDAARKLEKDRLRRLLEEETSRGRDRRRSRRDRRSESTKSDDSDASSRTRSRSSHKSSSRKRRHEKRHKKDKRSRRGDSKKSKRSRKKHSKDYSSGYSSYDSQYSGSSSARHESRRREKWKEPRGGIATHEELPAILARPKHRIWN